MVNSNESSKSDDSNKTSKLPQKVEKPRSGKHYFQNASSISLSIWIVFMITGLHLTSLYIFSKGFLLNRTILTNQTIHDQNQPLIEPTHSKAIIILIDALRFDFVLPSSSSSSNLTNHQGFSLKLPSKLSLENPLNSRLYHLVADPPTTTLQRLKGITTGTLPTFIDLGSNFDSTHSTIQEDSWIHQLFNSKKTIGFTGDDTWINLFGIRSSSSPLSDGLFDDELSHGFESFNVEDLDTVDQGVEDHLFQILGIDQSPDPSSQIPKKGWDVLIGHFLGLDHAGHRFGASHPTISSKLDQYDRFLEKVVSKMDDDTLLVVLGDHGMDSKGDHGGDSFLETSTALWLYSRTRTLSDRTVEELPEWVLKEEDDFITPQDSSVLRSRTVSQIDLVPTLSLLLGLPIPFSNLGMIIPELFYRSSLTVDSKSSQAQNQEGTARSTHRKPPKVLEPVETMLLASEANSRQLLTFLETYAGQPDSPGYNDLSGYTSDLRALYQGAHKLYRESHFVPSFRIHRDFGASLLGTSRKIWARFAPNLMFTGILILVLSLVASLTILDRIKSTTAGPQAPIRSLIGSGVKMGSVGAFLGILISGLKINRSMDLMQHSISGSALGTCFGLITHQDGSLPSQKGSYSSLPSTSQLIKLVPLLLHALALGSNSYTVWEDQVVVYLTSAAVLIPVVVRSFGVPQKRLRNRLLLFGLLFGICVRLISLSTVCREEQYRWCSVTFYADSTSSSAPSWVMTLLIPVAICVPIALAWFLGISDSYRGAASIYFGTGLRLSLLCGVQYWISDFIISQGDLSFKPSLKLTGTWIKTMVARVDLGICFVGLVGLWYILPLCIDVEREEAGKEKLEEVHDATKKPRVYVIGFANSYGSSYLMYLSAIFGILFLVNQPMGELTISIGLIAILSLVEIHDSLNDARVIDQSFKAAVNAVATGKPLPADGSREGEDPDPRFDRSRRRTDFLTISGLSLLSYVIFFGTGHQATFASIQWKTGFIGISTAHQLWSGLMIALNTFGGFILVSLSIPLLGAWNLSPVLGKGGRVKLTSEVVEGSVKLMNYQAVLGLSSMLSCSVLRRHLMVWKIFAPRFMMASLVIIVVDLVICFLSVGWGLSLLVHKVKRTFGTESI